MSKRDIKNRINVLKQQLFLITNYRVEFDEILGKTSTNNLIDEILDELILLEKELKK